MRLTDAELDELHHHGGSKRGNELTDRAIDELRELRAEVEEWKQWGEGQMNDAVRTLAENAKLVAALGKAKEDLIWSTGGWGQATDEVLAPARIVIRQNIEAIDVALASVKGEV